MTSAPATAAAQPSPAVVLFDGECGFCAQSVQFILRRDPRGRFRFASLQSPRGQELLAHHGLPQREFASIVLIEDGRTFLRSAAGLRICRRLNRGWPLLYGFIVLPRAWRDAAYDWIARRRLKLAPAACALPTAEERGRFLE